MKLLLLQPPVQDYYDTEVRLQPLGLCCLKGAVRSHVPDVEVVVKDFHAGQGRRTIRVPHELGHLRPYYPAKDRSPFSLFSSYYHFGASLETIGSVVAREKPDLVGISSLFSAYHEEAAKCAREIKTRLDVPILVGGGHPTALPEAVLGDPAVDFIIRGEGERALVSLIEALRDGRELESVPNLGFKSGGKLILNPVGENYPMDELPVPDMSDLNPRLYTMRRRSVAAIVSSRGCPCRCDFCSVHTTFSKGYRRRSNQSILDEIAVRYAAGYRVFDFEDDNFALDRPQTEQLLEEIIRRYRPGALELFAMNGLCYFGLDPKLVRLMNKAGFRQLNLSLVSANPDVCAAHHRTCQPETFAQAVEEACGIGMQVIGYLILGLPGESLDSMIRTLALLARLPVVIGASIFYLAPGSALWDREGGKPEQIKSARLTALAIHSDQVSRNELYTLLISARIINFVKSLKLDSASAGTSLEQALDRATDGRSKHGARLLRTLLSDGRLFGWDGRQDYPLEKFRAEVFRRVWKEIGGIRTTGGQVVKL